MRRRLLSLLTGLSLLLCVAGCALWVRSYWCFDRAWGERGSWTFVAESYCGGVRIAHYSASLPGWGFGRAPWYEDGPLPGLGSYARALASFEVDPEGSAALEVPPHVTVPHWALAAAAGIAPALRLREYRRRHRNAGRGLCGGRGFELTSTARGGGGAR